MKQQLTFILMKTKDNSVGMLNQMIHQGSKVISRKSLKILVPYKSWDSTSKRVKNNHPESEAINQQIEKTIREFNKVKFQIPDGDDRQCAIEYIKRYLGETEIKIKYPIATIQKYETIINNFEYVSKKTLKMDSLPFALLRDKSFVKNLKLEIRKNVRKKGSYKKNTSWFNYMSVFGTLVEKWNTTSGTQFPINTKIFTSDISDDEKKYANTLTRNEICQLGDYVPKGYRKGESQLLAKNIFLFQYYTGGIRIQDTLTLTNKAIKSDGIEIKIKKSKRNQKFPFCYEQVECLKPYYPEEYERSEEICRVSHLEINANTLLQLYRLDGVGDIKEFNLNKLEELKNNVLNLSKENPELSPFIETIDDIIVSLKDRFSDYFFGLLRKRPQHFLFPTQLKWIDFMNVFKENSNEKLNKRQASLIHNATATHNSNLKRISKNLGFCVIGGHTPRHSISNHMYNEGESPESIRDVLLHSSLRTTYVYLQERHGNANVSDSMKRFMERHRQIKKQKDMRGF